MKISQRKAKLCLDNRNKTFPVEMALVETPQILEAELVAIARKSEIPASIAVSTILQ
jgi:hypothetical protein